MKMKSIGNLILITLICVAVFIVFMAIRPARAALAIHAMGSAIFDRRLRARAHSAGLSGAAAARSLCLCQGGQSALHGEEDVRCRAAIVGNSVNAIIPIKLPSDDVVQTAPVKCRYTESGIC